MEKFINKDMLEKVYDASFDEIDEKILEIQKHFNTEDKNSRIEKVIESIKKEENKKNIRELIEYIEEFENRKISIYNKEMYKIGFADGVNLIINCLIKNYDS